MPLGFALTDPDGRISRTRFFPRVTRVISEPSNVWDRKRHACGQIASQSRQVNFSRTVSITLNRRGISSSVSMLCIRVN